ncbi:MAG: 4Fe-4S dicluster domain-containing protein [Firmicutes bacterium]|jgi:ferredoxin|nr:4Fe-4S dicluster domain-containing protein [Bacillota bacterium]MBQ4372419.1 4Fe-4S dicluster domain-containing protein [Bacillota bacterium]
MKKISKAKIDELFKAISAKETLYIPVDDSEGQAAFIPYAEGLKMSEDLNTVRSAKDLFFPQVESLVNFKMDGKHIEIIDAATEKKPFVIFGVRACDARSFDILDRVFYYAEPKDSFYIERRDKSTVVTLACNAPEETCFCGAFGIDPAEPAGDVSAWQDGESFFFKANTEKGEALLAGLPLEDAADDAADKVKEDIRKITAMLPLKDLDLSKFGPGKTQELFNDPAWATLSESCLGCGTCTFVCPTCQCFDIRDFDGGKEIRRFRCWDSCMYSDFTQMSAGQPRPTQKERFRQRFMHKLVYYPDMHEGLFSCVGCGRCLRKCPIHMNIVKVIKTIGEEK